MTPEVLTQLHNACDHLTHAADRVRQETHEVIATQDHAAVIKHYDKLRHITAVIKIARDALSHIEEHLSREDIPDVMRAHNIRSITIEGVGRVSLGHRWSASMIEKEPAMTWLRDNGNGGVIQETVNAQTLGALAKELNNDGVELPQDLFKTSVLTYTSITKA